MGTDSGIQYVHHSLNFWKGCQPVSEGCDNCYMHSDARRFGWDPTVVTRCGNGTFYGATTKQWKSGERIFVCSWSDFFHMDADPWRDEAWTQIKRREDLMFLIVTKRLENIRGRLPEDWGTGWPNVWLIATVENQRQARHRIPLLLDTPAAVRGISYEPALGPLDMAAWFPSNTEAMKVPDARCGHHGQLLAGAPCPDCFPQIHVIFAGCESLGQGLGRAVDPNWFRSVRDQCVQFGVPFFLKQMDVDGRLTHMPELDGVVWDQLPEGAVM